ncbi:MAG: serine hydrolase domain-containing protein [Gemmatimonadales bacterium]
MRLAFPAALLLLAACARTGPTLVPERQQHDWSGLVPLLDSAVAAGAAPGAVLGISWRGERFIYGTGRLGRDDGRRPDGRTVYDLASLTKVIALTPLMMQAVEAGRVDLDGPLSGALPEMAGGWADSVTIRQLLTHVSGLPAHRRLWELAPDAVAALDTVKSTPLDTLPGARTVYSDLGLILLGKVIERVYNQPLAVAFQERMARPLGLTDTRYLPPRDWRGRIAPTEQDPWRGRMLRAEVHDENAAFLGGVAAHAGLFGSTEDLLRFGEWLVTVTRSEGTVLSGEEWLVDGAVAREFTRRQELVAGSSRALGWDVPGTQLWPGLGIPASAVWHTGFTGTAIWVAPSHQLVIVLLANRVHPTRNNNRHVALRREVASRIWLRIVGCTTYLRCEPTT